MYHVSRAEYFANTILIDARMYSHGGLFCVFYFSFSFFVYFFAVFFISFFLVSVFFICLFSFCFSVFYIYFYPSLLSTVVATCNVSSVAGLRLRLLSARAELLCSATSV